MKAYICIEIKIYLDGELVDPSGIPLANYGVESQSGVEF